MQPRLLMVVVCACLGVVLCMGSCSHTAPTEVYTLETIPDTKHANDASYVSNPDSILSPEAEQQINALLWGLEQTTSIEVAVVLVPAVDAQDLDMFTHDLFNRWRIGKPGKDNGLLVLFVLNERFLRIETGYGLEGDLPDALCSRIMRNTMFPAFKDGDYDRGMVEGVTEIIQQLTPTAHEPTLYDDASDVTDDDVTPYLYDSRQLPTSEIDEDDQALEQLDYTPSEEPRHGVWGVLDKIWSWQFYLLVNIVVVLLVAVVLMLRVLGGNKSNVQVYEILSKHMMGWQGCLIVLLPLLIPYVVLVWYMQKRVRLRPVPCPICHSKMHRLDTEASKAYRTEVQQLEDTLQSVYHDVWYCDSCRHPEVCSYINSRSAYIPCPSCGARTYGVTHKKVLQRATTTRSGKGVAYYACQRCAHKGSKEYTIARVSSDSSSSGHSSSSSSSGRSSSSSSRGGSSGGGGSSGRW